MFAQLCPSSSALVSPAKVYYQPDLSRGAGYKDLELVTLSTDPPRPFYRNDLQIYKLLNSLVFLPSLKCCRQKSPDSNMATAAKKTLKTLSTVSHSFNCIEATLSPEKDTFLPF